MHTTEPLAGALIMKLTLAPEEFGTAVRTKTNRPAVATPEPPSLPEGEPRPASYTQWTRMAGDQYFGVGRTYPILPAGLYCINRINNEPSFTRIQQNVDELLRFPDSIGDAVLKEIDTFWNRIEYFQKYNVLHRRGYLFYGPPGSGKSCLIQQIVADIIARGGIVFLGGHPGLFRTVQSGAPSFPRGGTAAQGRLPVRRHRIHDRKLR